jgi:hypothetical protein
LVNSGHNSTKPIGEFWAQFNKTIWWMNYGHNSTKPIGERDNVWWSNAFIFRSTYTICSVHCLEKLHVRTSWQYHYIEIMGMFPGKIGFCKK